MKYRKLVVSIIILILVLGIGYWLSFYIHPKPNQPLDSSEVYRSYLNSDSMASRVAAMIILAGQGDQQGTNALIEFYSKPTATQTDIYDKRICIGYLKSFDKTQISTKLIAALIKTSDKSEYLMDETLDLISVGHERDHLALIEELIRHGYASYRFDRILERINQEELFKLYHQVLQKKYLKKQYNIPYFSWAKAYYAIHTSDPLKGYLAIDYEFPGYLQSNIKRNYASILTKKGYYQEAINIWLSLPDTTSQSRFYYAIRDKWYDIPDVQKARLSDIDRNKFTTAYNNAFGC
jgi:hypothetical protein